MLIPPKRLDFHRLNPPCFSFLFQTREVVNGPVRTHHTIQPWRGLSLSHRQMTRPKGTRKRRQEEAAKGVRTLLSAPCHQATRGVPGSNDSSQHLGLWSPALDDDNLILVCRGRDTGIELRINHRNAAAVPRDSGGDLEVRAGHGSFDSA